MKTVFCKRGKYFFPNGDDVFIETLAFIIPWRKEDDIFKNQNQVQQVANLIEKIYVYEKCFGGIRHNEFVHNEGAYTKNCSQEGLMELKNKLKEYIATFDCSIDKEDNFVVFDRQPWRTDTGDDKLRMSRRLGVKNFIELPDLTKIDEE